MKTKFNKKEKYKSLCLIISPNGAIKEGTVLTGKQWMNLLGYDVSEHSFDQMFTLIKEKSNKKDEYKLPKVLKIGMVVSFYYNRIQRNIFGTIVKINKKTIKIVSSYKRKGYHHIKRSNLEYHKNWQKKIK